MTNKTKKILIIAGLIVCLIITILANTEANHREIETTSNVNPSTTQVFATTGAKCTLETISKLLKPIL